MVREGGALVCGHGDAFTVATAAGGRVGGGLGGCHLGTQRASGGRRGGEGVEGLKGAKRLDGVAVGGGDEAQGPRVAARGLCVAVAAVQVAYGFGNVVVVIAYRDLWNMAASHLVDALEFAGSVVGLRRVRRSGQQLQREHCYTRVWRSWVSRRAFVGSEP